MTEPCFFLGANSGAGFASQYEQLLGGTLHDLLILKGGPGSGKSTFMRFVADYAAQRGEEGVRFACSGDPDSLDGVIFPARRVALVDGTAPHVLEPTYAVAAERCVDLFRFYDVEACKAKRAEIAAFSDAYRAAYRDAYHVLHALDAVEEERRAAAFAHLDPSPLLRRAEGILRREIGSREQAGGSVQFAYLGGLTCKGPLCCYESAEALCPRVYELQDANGLGDAMLKRLGDAAKRSGNHVLACLNPDRPQEWQHLLIPERGVAFVTSNGRWNYPGKPYRRLRLDALAEKNLTRAERSRLRFSRRISAALEAEAVGQLQRAKEAHDALEAVYRPFVDFDGIAALARQEAQRLFGV